MTCTAPTVAGIRRRRHIVHLVYRFAAGGLENVVVQLVNGLPEDRYTHTVVALTDVDHAFATRIQRPDVRFVSLRKSPGQPFALYPKVFRLLRQIKPDVLHSCNLAALEFTPVAALARVGLRVQAEHGWDIADPQGLNKRYQLLRRLYSPFVHQFLVVSDQLQSYLVERVGLRPEKVVLVRNGVDTMRFRPAFSGEPPPSDFPFSGGQYWVVGSVGRLESIKNHALLARAFVRMVQSYPQETERHRLAIVGAGPLRQSIRGILDEAGLADRVWMPGARGDIPELLRSFDCFVLPSHAEGTSCTLQEAMATGLPIIATDVGGNRQTLLEGQGGILIGNDDEAALVAQMMKISRHSPADQLRSDAIRGLAESHFSLQRVLSRYHALFSG